MVEKSKRLNPLEEILKALQEFNSIVSQSNGNPELASLSLETAALVAEKITSACGRIKEIDDLPQATREKLIEILNTIGGISDYIPPKKEN